MSQGSHAVALDLHESEAGSYVGCPCCGVLGPVALAGTPCPWCARGECQRAGRVEHISAPLGRALAKAAERAKHEGEG